MNSLTLTQYVLLAIRTEKPLPTLGRLTHACMGMVTEIGEVVTELKRMAIYGKPLDADRKKHILEEIGDVMWYVAILLHALDVEASLFDTTINNIPATQEGKYEALTLRFGTTLGEVCLAVQLALIHEKVTNGNHNQICSNLETLMKGLRVLAQDCDSTLELAMFDNIEKLRLRFPDAYSNEAAEARADKGGLDARNS